MAKVTHGMTHTPEYHAYWSALERCRNPKNKRWYSHGGRGIEFRFKSFSEFYKELGNRTTPDHSLDRIDNNGHYEVGNVRWATFGEQQSNKNVYTLIKRTGKGYCWNNLHKKWQARIRFKRVCEHLGYFDKESEASEAYQKRYKEIKEEHEQRISSISGGNQTQTA